MYNELINPIQIFKRRPKCESHCCTIEEELEALAFFEDAMIEVWSQLFKPGEKKEFVLTRDQLLLERLQTALDKFNKSKSNSEISFEEADSIIELIDETNLKREDFESVLGSELVKHSIYAPFKTQFEVLCSHTATPKARKTALIVLKNSGLLNINFGRLDFADSERLKEDEVIFKIEFNTRNADSVRFSTRPVNGFFSNVQIDFNVGGECHQVLWDEEAGIGINGRFGLSLSEKMGYLKQLVRQLQEEFQLDLTEVTGDESGWPWQTVSYVFLALMFLTNCVAGVDGNTTVDISSNPTSISSTKQPTEQPTSELVELEQPTSELADPENEPGMRSLEYQVTSVAELLQVQQEINLLELSEGSKIIIRLAEGVYDLTSNASNGSHNQIEVFDKRADIEELRVAEVGFGIITNADVEIIGVSESVIKIDLQTTDIGLYVRTPGDVHISGISIVDFNDHAGEFSDADPSVSQRSAPPLKAAIYVDNSILLPDGSMGIGEGEVLVRGVEINLDKWSNPEELEDSLCRSGIITRGKAVLKVVECNLSNITWDGIVGFNASRVIVDRVSMQRPQEFLLGSGAAVAIVTDFPGGNSIEVNSTEIVNFCKGAAIINAGELSLSGNSEVVITNTDFMVTELGAYGYYVVGVGSNCDIVMKEVTVDRYMSFIFNTPRSCIISDSYFVTIDHDYPHFELRATTGEVTVTNTTVKIFINSRGPQTEDFKTLNNEELIKWLEEANILFDLEGLTRVIGTNDGSNELIIINIWRPEDDEG